MMSWGRRGTLKTGPHSDPPRYATTLVCINAILRKIRACLCQGRRYELGVLNYGREVCCTRLKNREETISLGAPDSIGPVFRSTESLPSNKSVWHFSSLSLLHVKIGMDGSCSMQSKVSVSSRAAPPSVRYGKLCSGYLKFEATRVVLVNVSNLYITRNRSYRGNAPCRSCLSSLF